MNTLQIILLIAIAILGYPIGKFIASKTPEELKAGKIWFKLIMSACVFGAILSLILAQGSNLLILLASLIFIFLMSFASIKCKKKK